MIRLNTPIKACLAGKGDSLGKSHNTEQEQA
jgi:hypothetical protein